MYTKCFAIIIYLGISFFPQDNTIQIFGKHKTKGVLTLVDTFQLSGCPVQMEAISSQEVIRYSITVQLISGPRREKS